MSDLKPSPIAAALDPSAVDALTEAIAHRRSLGAKRLLPDAVDPRLIQRALEAADWAPSHGDTEPWRFTVYAGESRTALGDAFAEAYRIDAEANGTFNDAAYEANRQRVQGVPVWIAIGIEPALEHDGRLSMSEEEELMAVACAVQNLHLVLSAQGIAGMWLSKGMFRYPRIAEFVGLTGPYSRLLGFFIAGWPQIDWPEGERRPLAEKVRWAE